MGDEALNNFDIFYKISLESQRKHGTGNLWKVKLSGKISQGNRGKIGKLSTKSKLSHSQYWHCITPL